MSFEAIELSVDDGRPIELLRVSVMSTNWYFTSAEMDIVYDGATYNPLPIKHGAIPTTGDVAKSSLTIGVPFDCPLGELFRVHPPSAVVSVTLFNKHMGDPEATVIWKGRIVNCEWEHPWLSMTTENVFSSLQRTGLRRKFSVQCQHPLYSEGSRRCNVNKDSYKVVGVTSGVVGVTVSSASIGGRPAGYFAGGYAEWVHNVSGRAEQRMITGSHSSGYVTLSAQPIGLAAGQQITFYPGCDHLPSTCHSKFANSLNYGGTPYIPKKNPFGGTSLY